MYIMGTFSPGQLVNDRGVISLDTSKNTRDITRAFSSIATTQDRSPGYALKY
jgi:hypothetical protein